MFRELVEAAEAKLGPHATRCAEDKAQMKAQGYKESDLQGLRALRVEDEDGGRIARGGGRSRRNRVPTEQMTAAQLAQHSSDPVPRFHLSKIQQQAIKRNETRKNDNTGRKWFNMPAVKMTQDVKDELKLLKLRNTLDPKHYFKRDDHSGLPKYFQMGRIKESAAEFYMERTSKKAKKMSLVDELLEDSQRRQARRKRMAKIIAAKSNYTRKGRGRKQKRK